MSNIEKVCAMKFPEAFIRMWEYYLCYIEGGIAPILFVLPQQGFLEPVVKGLFAQPHGEKRLGKIRSEDGAFWDIVYFQQGAHGRDVG